MNENKQESPPLELHKLVKAWHLLQDMASQKDLIKKIEHELITTDNLYACDNPEGKHLFQLDHTDLIQGFTKFIESFEKGIGLLQTD